MSKLSNFYQHKATIQQSGEFSDVSSMQWDALEEKLIREDLMPRLMQQIAPLLQEVQSALSININYNPEGTIAMTFTRNCVQTVYSLGTQKQTNAIENVENSSLVIHDDSTPDIDTSERSEEEDIKTEQQSSEEEMAEEDADEEDSENILDEESGQEHKAKRPRRKSVGFRVTFPDGEMILEKNGISTFVKALKKFGLSKLAHGDHGIEHNEYALVGTKPYQYGEGEKRVKKQEIVGDYYIYINISNEDKIDDLYQIGDFYHIPLQIHEMRDSGPVLIKNPVPESEIVKKTKQSKEEVQTNTLSTDIKAEFLQYMEQRISHDSAVGYLRHLNNGVRKYINLLVDDKADSVFSFTSLDEVNLCIQLLEEDEEYNKANDEQHHYYSASIKQWQKFVEKLNQI